MGAEESKRVRTVDDAMNASVSVTGKRVGEPVDAGENLNGPPRNQGKRRRLGDLHSAFVSDEEVVKVRAQ